ncbi:SDR family NAD(P)-dependent oxidoreductase [Cognatishimia sp.]|uniref:SDR family NAD(P)-dependent oxidoreductase n=1 Tax=Cognatishimia sp. TaxID=2211648 RepID=UPI0035167AE4
MSFKGTREQWPDTLRQILTAQAATDIVYFADRFPYHRDAQRVARDMGVRCVSMEYGYVRPDWLILEEGGQSAYSHFPDDLTHLLQVAKDLPPFDRTPKFKISPTEEAIKEAGFHLTNALAQPFQRHYKPERAHPPLIEFPAYIPRFIKRAKGAKHAQAEVDRLTRMDAPRFIVPLQMQGDYQIRANAPVGFQYGFVSRVLSSFAQGASTDARLVFKLHPMDNGLINWKKKITEQATDLGISHRVTFLDGGDLGKLFSGAAGCVVVNSTAGIQALLSGVPTKALGVAIYDIEGVTYQGDLDDFWTQATPPDTSDVDALTTCLAHGIHARGTVYGKGRAAFVENAVARLESTDLHAHGLYVAEPPRLRKAARLGIATDAIGTSQAEANPRKRIAITGASTGLGAALATKLAAPGVSFALCARDTAPFKTLAATLRTKGADVEFASVDLSIPGAAETWLKEVWDNGAIDQVILNAGIFDGRDEQNRLESPTRATRLLSTNLSGAVEAALTASTLMQTRGAGHLVFISSLAAFGPQADAPTYSASKSGLTAFARALREALMGTNVFVTLVHPGHIKSRQTDQHIGPLPGIMSPEDAAEIIAGAMDKKTPEIAFPWHLSVGLKLMSILPWRLQALINKRLRFRVRS